MERLSGIMLVLSFHGNVVNQTTEAVQEKEPMKKILVRKNLPYFGALVQAGLFSYAGMRFFGSFGWLVGFGVGMIVNYSLALAASNISDIAAKRKPLAYAALITMFSLSPTTITLSMFFPSTIWAAIAWAMCVDLAIVLAGAIAGKSLVSQSEPLKVAQQNERTAQSRRANRSKSQSKIPCRYAGAGCELIGSQNAMNAHARHCKFKPSTIEDLIDVSAKQ